MAHPGEIKAAACNISGNEHPDFALLEAVEDRGAFALVQAPMDILKGVN